MSEEIEQSDELIIGAAITRLAKQIAEQELDKLSAMVRQLNIDLASQAKNHQQEIGKLQGELQRSKSNALELQRQIGVWAKEIDKLNTRIDLMGERINYR